MGSDVNQTKIGRSKVTDIEYYTVAPFNVICVSSVRGFKRKWPNPCT